MTGPERPPSLCNSSGEVKGDDTSGRSRRATVLSVGHVLRRRRNSERRVSAAKPQLGLPIQIEKAYAMVPNQRLLVVRYTLTNNIRAEGGKQVRVRFAEVRRSEQQGLIRLRGVRRRPRGTGLNSDVRPAAHDMRAQWHPELNAWIADMSASNGRVRRLRRVSGYGSASRVRDRLRPGGRSTTPSRPELAIVRAARDARDVETHGVGRWPVDVEASRARAGSDSEQYSFFYAVDVEPGGGASHRAGGAQSRCCPIWFDSDAGLRTGRGCRRASRSRRSDPGLRGR